jgi:hypothetical protein
MSLRIATVSIAILLCLGGAWMQLAPQAVADHSDGNMPYSVNYWVVEGTLAVCNNSTNVSANQLNSAIAGWNSGIGGAILVSSCTNWGVNITTVDDGGCGPAPALPKQRLGLCRLPKRRRHHANTASLEG